VFVRLAKDLVHEAQQYKLRHPNIVMLIAVTFELHHYGAIFEFITYGGLDSFLEDYEVRFMMTVDNTVKIYSYFSGKLPEQFHRKFPTTINLPDNCAFAYNDSF